MVLAKAIEEEVMERVMNEKVLMRLGKEGRTVLTTIMVSRSGTVGHLLRH